MTEHRKSRCTQGHAANSWNFKKWWIYHVTFTLCLYSWAMMYPCLLNLALKQYWAACCWLWLTPRCAACKKKQGVMTYTSEHALKVFMRPQYTLSTLKSCRHYTKHSFNADFYKFFYFRVHEDRIYRLCFVTVNSFWARPEGRCLSVQCWSLCLNERRAWLMLSSLWA